VSLMYGQCADCDQPLRVGHVCLEKALSGPAKPAPKTRLTTAAEALNRAVAARKSADAEFERAFDNYSKALRDAGYAP
jgi:hypothetical protein